MSNDKCLKDMLALENVIENCPPRYLNESNMDSLKQQLEVGPVDLKSNDEYRLEENLKDSKVLGSLLIQ